MSINPKLIPEFLQARAEKLGLVISVLEPEERNAELDYGPFVLCCAEDPIWISGLPVEGIVDALNCYEREMLLDEEKEVGNVWKNFGAGWAEAFIAKCEPPLA